jgi:hypothetical protein
VRRHPLDASRLPFHLGTYIVKHGPELTLLKVTDVFTECDSKQEFMEWLKSQELPVLDECSRSHQVPWILVSFIP